ncbi:MAG TPA: hypothetical protein VF043_14030 [Ktedonobacteraceae bacterium]
MTGQIFTFFFIVWIMGLLLAALLLIPLIRRLISTQDYKKIRSTWCTSTGRIILFGFSLAILAVVLFPASIFINNTSIKIGMLFVSLACVLFSGSLLLWGGLKRLE